MIVVGGRYLYITAGTRIMWTDGNTYMARFSDQENPCEKCCFRDDSNTCDEMEKRYRIRCDLRTYLVREKNRHEKEADNEHSNRAARTYRLHKQSLDIPGWAEGDQGNWPDSDSGDRITWGGQALRLHDPRD